MDFPQPALAQTRRDHLGQFKTTVRTHDELRSAARLDTQRILVFTDHLHPAESNHQCVWGLQNGMLLLQRERIAIGWICIRLKYRKWGN